MAIQTIYTLVDNATIKPCLKGKPISPLAIPLLRNNYLGEYKSLKEKDKVLNNLGILGVTSLYTYPSDEEISDYKDIATVQLALDYCIRLIKSYLQSDENIKLLLVDVTNLLANLKTLQGNVGTNTTSINEINQLIIDINNAISEFDTKLKDLDVDDKITNRINQHLANSKTIELVDETTLETKQSIEENNAIEVKNDGLFVKNLTPEIEANKTSIDGLATDIGEVNDKIELLKTDIDASNKYTTEVNASSPYDVGGLKLGTTSELLNGKTISAILDMMLFPTYVRDLVYPKLSYSSIAKIVEIGSTIVKPTLTFTLNDAGAELNRVETIQYNGNEVTSTTYTNIGTYTFIGTVSYDNGEYLINNKDELTDIRVEAGSLTTLTSTVATYPWYAGNTKLLVKQELAVFNSDSKTYTVSLSGLAVVKLPGANTLLKSFKVDGGLGFLDVDLSGWTESTETINGITYKVWTKKEEYVSIMPHQIQFKLVQ